MVQPLSEPTAGPLPGVAAAAGAKAAAGAEAAQLGRLRGRMDGYFMVEQLRVLLWG